MENINLNANQKAARKLLATYVDVSTTSTPEWQIIGAGVEDSSIEYNNEVNTVTDILGITETDIQSQAPQQAFEPFTIRGGSKLHEKLLDILRRNALTELSQFRVLVAEGYLGSNSGIPAEVHEGCTIEVTAKGGSSHVDMPINIYYSNKKNLGTVDAISTAPTFSPAT